MLTNKDVGLDVVFVKCPSCGGKHLLGASKDGPVYWCGSVLKKLRKEDVVEGKNNSN